MPPALRMIPVMCWPMRFSNTGYPGTIVVPVALGACTTLLLAGYTINMLSNKILDALASTERPRITL